MMQWFDVPHDHPFFKKCTKCSAAPEFEQLLVAFIFYMVIIGGSIAFFIYKGLEAAVEVYRP